MARASRVARIIILLNQILDDVDGRDIPGLEAVREFLSRSLAISDQLIRRNHVH
jgi:hypothetical protein